ncbi:MAG TPA: FtsX-like permease family protein [Chitinophagaceae bacterium]
MNDRKGIHLSWLAKMAWRDSRRNRSRLFLFVSSIVLGIAALVAIYSLSHNMREEIREQAASLIGADLELSSNRPISANAQKLVDSLGDRRSEQQSFLSMVLFPKSGGTRLVQVRALEGEYPYYGELESIPAGAGTTFRRGQQALVDRTLMMQFGINPGDSVKVGNVTFAVAGALQKAPGQTGFSASTAPAVYIPLRYLEATGLSQKGSRITYKYYYKWNRPRNVDALVESMEPRLNSEGLDWETVASQQQDTSRSFRDLTRFLSLVGFVALLLGCIGVASAIHIYVKEKVASIAVLRCLGATALQAFLIFLIQIVSIGAIGSVVGAALGTVIQQFLPAVLSEFLPIELEPSISWPAIGQGIVLGLIISLLFALLPLISIRRISPLLTLRLSFQHTHTRDAARWLVYGLILLFVFGFTWLQVEGWREALFFTLGIVVAFLLLSGIALLLMWGARRFFPDSWSYLWRQGLANLFRPNNQTVILILSIGLGTAFISTLFFVQSILLSRINFSTSGNQSNMVLFDIQPAQREGVMALARSQGLPVNGTVPIVNMRLESVNEITAARLEADSTLPMQRWVFSREYRVTFRDSLTASEKVTKGKWTGVANPAGGPVYVSVEQRYADRNGIDIGDTMTFNVQGAMMPTIVGSLREVDWNRIQTNFLVVFPKGVLEEAPQFHVLLTRVPSNAASAQFQQALVRRFPNVSIIDLKLVLSVIDEILDKIGFIIRFMGGFSILTGLVVLIASVLISRYQRIQESILLRTLGASRRQILVITALEYFLLGAFAAATGIVLALGGSWALARWSFETPFTPEVWPIVVVFLSVCFLTVVIGLANSRGILSKPPLEILRQEV